MFNLEGKNIDIIVNDIYFIIGLSRWGQVVSRKWNFLGVASLSVHKYVNYYYVSRTQNTGSQISISTISSFPLNFIMKTITRVARTATLHLATRNHMQIGIECLQGKIFEWCIGLLEDLKIQLTDCKTSKVNKLGHGRIIVSFFS